jgi:hypothetical protein
MSLRSRRLAATLVAALGLAGAATVSTLATNAFGATSVTAGCPDPRTCGEPNLTHRPMIAAVGRLGGQVVDCPDPDNCTPPR